MRKESAISFLRYYSLFGLFLDIPYKDALSSLIKRDRKRTEEYFKFYFKSENVLKEKKEVIPFSRILFDILFNEEVSSFLLKKINSLTSTLSVYILDGIKFHLNKKKDPHLLLYDERKLYSRYKNNRELNMSIIWKDIYSKRLPKEAVENIKVQYGGECIKEIGRISFLYSTIIKNKRILDKVFYGHNEFISSSSEDGKIKLLEIVNNLVFLLHGGNFKNRSGTYEDIYTFIREKERKYDVEEKRISFI